MIDLSDLPDELQAGQGEAAPEQLTEEELAARYQRLQDLGRLMAGKRDAAIKARRESGIEDVWTACEEAYAGIDEANRADVAGAGHAWRKPTSPSGPLTRDAQRQAEARSTVYVRLTTRYVDIAAAKVKEKALPIGGMPFSLSPSPSPDPVKTLSSAQQPAQAGATPPAAPIPAAAGQPGAATPPGAAPAAPPPEPSPAASTKESADKAGKRIWDWLEESKFAKQIRHVIDDAARIGVGVLKGPFPKGTTERALSKKGDKALLEIVQRTYPGAEWVDPWNFFPAGNCGENVHDGDGVFERGFMAEGKMRALKDLREPGGTAIYLGEAIDLVIDQGPDKCNYDTSGARTEVPADKKGLYKVWQYTGEMTREDMISLQALGAADLPDEIVYCNAIVTLVNDTVIRAQFNPLETSGNFGYRVLCWSRRVGHWAGVGPGEQVAVPQKMINAGTRSWMNNAGVSSGVQLIIDRHKLVPADNSLVIGGGIKIWETTAEAMGVDVRTLMAAIAIPNLGAELKAIVDYAFQLAEELSNIPLVTQGRDGPTTPQTFGQAELQNTNGNTLLRAIADTLDSEIFEPLIDDYYEWLLLDPDVPDDEKGDFQIIAKGCTAMVEKAIQEQTLLLMGNMALNPAFGISPERWMEMFTRVKRIDHEELALTDAEKQARSQPPPDAPQVQAAKINAATTLHVQDMRDQVQLRQIQDEAAREQNMLQSGGTTPHMAMATARIEQEKIRATTAENIESSRADAENSRAQKELEIARENGWFRLKEMEMQRDLAILQYTQKHNLTLEQVKAGLAKTSMQEQTKRELAGARMALDSNEAHNDRMHEMALNQPTTPPQADVAAPPDDTAAA